MNTLKLTAIVTAILISGSVYADPHRINHPNLRDAFRACGYAMRHIHAAYEHNANRGAFGGHAARAQRLLQEARREIQEANTYRNQHMRYEHQYRDGDR